MLLNDARNELWIVISLSANILVKVSWRFPRWNSNQVYEGWNTGTRENNFTELKIFSGCYRCTIIIQKKLMSFYQSGEIKGIFYDSWYLVHSDRFMMTLFKVFFWYNFTKITGMLTSFNFMFIFHVYRFSTFVCKIYDVGCTHIGIEFVKQYICRSSTHVFPVLKVRLSILFGNIIPSYR